MNLGIRDRTAVVLAATGGLGKATALALAAEGANVVVVGRNGTKAKAMAERMPAAVAVECDLTDPDAPTAITAEARAAFGRIDIVVLNGPGPAPGTAVEVDVSDVRAAVDTLLAVHVALVREVLPEMRAEGWGRLLAIGSSAVESPLPRLAASNLGRAALAAYLKTLAAEVAADGVTVNMLLPGRIATDRVAFIDEVNAQRTGRPLAEIQAASRATIPAARYGEPAEFAAVAAFLCSAAASYVTGSLIRCDGGLLTNL